VADRRARLTAHAIPTQPDHLVQLAPVLDDSAGRERWSWLAGRIEAYREHLGIGLEDIRHPPIDGARYHEWNAAVKTAEMIQRNIEPQLDQASSGSRALGNAIRQRHYGW
jgi:hypothetical protein